MSILFINFGACANTLLMDILSIRVHTEGKLARLGQLAQPVDRLFYAGNFSELAARPCVAIVGSRKLTPYGRAVTTTLAGDLARAGVVIVSGLAIGIDSVAHQAALDAGGLTIAVLPSGLDHIYPAHHQRLADRILHNGGALVTEYAKGGGSPQKHQFIARNRIIAALSQGVLITEAAAKSGSLHTANFALEQGIEVFAVPGNITSSTSAGTNELIKTGATPVTVATDVLETLGLVMEQKSLFAPKDKNEAIIYSLLSEREQSVEELLLRTKIQPAELQARLGMLEINGAVRQTSAGTWMRAS